MSTTCIAPAVEGRRPAGLVSVNGKAFPLESAELEGRAEGGVASSVFIQTYRNPYNEPLEVAYTLPLPADGAVIGYEVHVGDKVIRGEVERREEATARYRQALFEGRTAAILEQDRADTFTQKLGCVPPGEKVKVRIEILQRLLFLPAAKGELQQWEYRFPTVVGIRYEGVPGRVPDAEKLDPDRAGGEGTPVRLRAHLEIADGTGSEILPSSPRHAIVTEDSGRAVRVALAEEPRLDRDLVIRWKAAKERVEVRVVSGPGLPGDDGRYGLVTVTPPARQGAGFGRDLTLLIDASGSMSGLPIESARKVAAALIRSLDTEDRFEVLAFSNDVAHLVRGPVRATEHNVNHALAALEGLQAGGSTEMAKAMQTALVQLRPDSQRQVILLTDGYVGFEREIIAHVLRESPPGTRLHTVGIGSAPNRSLTRAAARAGRGIETLISEEADVARASERLLAATVQPMLTDVEVTGSGILAIAPQHPGDVFRNQPLVLLARLNPSGGSLEVRGRYAGTSGLWTWRQDLRTAGAETVSTSIPLGALFGREAIEDCETQIACGTGSEAEIERLGLQHRIASRMTSLVAVAETPSVDPKAPRRSERLPVEVPAEVSAEMSGVVCQRAVAAPMLAMDSLGALAEPTEHLFRTAREVDYMAEHAAPLPARLISLIRGRVPSRLPIKRVSVLHVDGGTVVLEFEVPVDGFELPPDGERVDVILGDGSSRKAKVVGADSSPAGPHPAGVFIRLALRLKGNAAWAKTESLIRLHARVHSDFGAPKVEVALVLTPQSWPGE